MQQRRPRPQLLLILGHVVVSAILLGCNGTGQRTASVRPADPFEGVFAHPSVGILELRRRGETYRGTFTADIGKHPVEARRVDGGLHGTVTDGREDHPLTLIEADSGMLLTIDNTAAPAPLARYQNLKSYHHWLRQQGGYSIVEVRYEGANGAAPAATQPSLFGIWKTETMQTQLGPSTYTLELRPDGNYSGTITFQTDVPPINHRGTYTVKGDQLITEQHGQVNVARFTLEGDVLTTFDEKAKETYRFSRQQ